MSHGLVERQHLQDIGDAIRSKNGSSDTYTPAEMAQAISGIHTADEVVLVQKTVNANGQYNASDDSADGYSGVRVNVPNTYSTSDEGKVVSNGDLVAQTTKQITANGTHDTTTNNSVAVDVPNSYTASDNGKVVVNQALVAQTSKNINANGTYDTTANNSVIVAVEGEGGGLDKTLLYSFNESQGGVWINTGVSISDVDLLLFEGVESGTTTKEIYVSKAIIPQSASAYMSIYTQSRTLNVQNRSEILYVSYNSVGSATNETNIYEVWIN